MLKDNDIVYRINRRIDRCYEMMTDLNEKLSSLISTKNTELTKGLYEEYQVLRKTFYRIIIEYNNYPDVKLLMLEDRLDILEGRFADTYITLKYLGDLDQ